MRGTRLHGRFSLLAGALLVLAACSEGAPLYTSLDEKQANRIKAVLVQEGIRATKRPGGSGRWEVHVPSARVPAAMEILHAEGLPGRSYESMGDLFKKEGFVSSPTEQRARYLFALSQELERTLTTIDGVLDARVHLALPQKKPLEKEAEAGSASVLIIHRPNAGLEQRETSIRAIVTDGLERINDPNRVTVQMFERAPPDVADPRMQEEEPSERYVWAAGGALGGVLLGAGIGGGLFWLRRRSFGADQSTVPAAQQAEESGSS